MRTTIDPESPVPLYHQIASAIRARIEAGTLAPGDVLEPLRTAAESWSVNLHTVRHAYAALARDGLVERKRGPGGTRVRASPAAGAAGPQLDSFVSRILREGRERFGLSPSALATAVLERGAPVPSARPVVWVVECSEWQCSGHAREIASRWDVDARVWTLRLPEEPPPGDVVSTYFHYNDIRRQWPRRLPSVRFLTVRPDPSLQEGLPAGVQAVRVGEWDRMTAEAVAADLSSLFESRRIRVEPFVLARPLRALPGGEGDTPILLAPRVWAVLGVDLRSHPRAFEVRYRFDEAELTSLARELRWRPAKGATA